MKIAIITDAWAPQVNGVVRTLKTTIEEIERRGHQVLRISPDMFASLPCPTYPEIRLALAGRRRIGKLLDAFAPDAIHIATEGPLGLAARAYCRRHDLRFTTAFHTRFPDYVAERTGLPPNLFWRYLRWFHGPAAHVLTATPRLAEELASHGVTRTAQWSRGVDLALFKAGRTGQEPFAGLPRPIQLYVGRIAPEKNLEAFLRLETRGTKVLVGDGPARAALQSQFPDARFPGAMHGEALAAAYAWADVFVFPSRTDTFGLVIIEALACGTPVAAFPVPGPLDITGADGAGVAVLDEDLGAAIDRALTLDRATCAAFAARFSWAACADQFLGALTPAKSILPARDDPPLGVGGLDPAANPVSAHHPVHIGL